MRREKRRAGLVQTAARPAEQGDGGVGSRSRGQKERGEQTIVTYLEPLDAGRYSQALDIGAGEELATLPHCEGDDG